MEMMFKRSLIIFMFGCTYLHCGREIVDCKFDFVSHVPVLYGISTVVSFQKHSLTDLNKIKYCYDHNNTKNRKLIPYGVNILNFSCNDIKDFSGLFEMFCTTVRVINLEKNQIGTISKEDLFKLKRAFPNLELLKLNFNPIFLKDCRELLEFARQANRPFLFKVEIYGRTLFLGGTHSDYFDEWQDSDTEQEGDETDLEFAIDETQNLLSDEDDLWSVGD